MILSDILSAIKPLKVVGAVDIDITDIQLDSRKVGTGAMFVAVAGTQVNGHTFIPKAVELGAAAIVCQTLPADLAEGVTYIVADDSEAAVGPMAHAFFGD